VRPRRRARGNNALRDFAFQMVDQGVSKASGACKMVGFPSEVLTMTDRANNKSEEQFSDAREAFWLQQYAAALTSGNRRSAAVALQFARQHNRVVMRAQQKDKQLG
jgi:hypothetical protein